jgi:hypothetical protein
MQRAPIDGIELEYEICGTGEPVVLIHAGLCADFFRPLIEQRALTDRYTLLRYHRTGYAGSGVLPGAVGFAQQAEHCRALMSHLGIERAHVVGQLLEREHGAPVRARRPRRRAVPCAAGTGAARSAEQPPYGDGENSR